MDTIFVKQVKEGGHAHAAGLCTGNKCFYHLCETYVKLVTSIFRERFSGASVCVSFSGSNGPSVTENLQSLMFVFLFNWLKRHFPLIMWLVFFWRLTHVTVFLLNFRWSHCQGEWSKYHWQSLWGSYSFDPGEVSCDFLIILFILLQNVCHKYLSFPYSGDFLELCVMPKDEDILQLVSFSLQSNVWKCFYCAKAQSLSCRVSAKPTELLQLKVLMLGLQSYDAGWLSHQGLLSGFLNQDSVAVPNTLLLLFKETNMSLWCILHITLNCSKREHLMRQV